MEGTPDDLRSTTSKNASRAQSESRRSSRHPRPSLDHLKAEVSANRKAITALLGEDCGQYGSIEKVRAVAQNLKKKKGDFQRASITLVEKFTAIGSLEEASEELNDRNDLLNQVGLGLAKLARKKLELGGSELSISEASKISLSPSEMERQQLFRTLKEKEAEDKVQSKIEELELQSRELQIRQESQSQIEQERLKIRKQALEREKIKRMTLAALNATTDSDPDLPLPVETDLERMVRFQGPENTRNPINPFINESTNPRKPAAYYSNNISMGVTGDSSHNQDQNDVATPNTHPHDLELTDGEKCTMGRVDPMTSDLNACVQPSLSQLDATTRYLGKMEFFRSSPTPFVRKASHYTTWREGFLAEAKELKLSPREMIRALQSHTGGEALRVVENFQDAGGMNPEATIEGIWEALAKQFGTSSRVTAHLVNQVNAFPEIGTMNVASKLQDLCDLCRQIGGQMSSVPGLRHFDTEIGIRSIANKLPGYIFNRWRRRGCSYEEENGGLSPPFSVFLEFLSRETDWANNPAYIQSRRPATETLRPSRPIQNDNLKFSSQRTLATGVDIRKSCPLHKSGNHCLEDCQVFHSMGINSKEDVIRRNGLCFRCLGPHKRVDCRSDIVCKKCSSQGHISALHSDDKNGNDYKETTTHQDGHYQPPSGLTSLCTSVCGLVGGRSCGKTVLADLRFPAGSTKTLRSYVIIDEESTSSFAHPSVFDFFEMKGEVQDYFLTTMERHQSLVSGMIGKGLTIQGVGKSELFHLPPLFGNSMIPDSKDEVAFPSMVRSQDHLRHLADNFQEFDSTAEVLVLLGRDAGNLLKSQQYGEVAPFANDTSLGWALVGSICPRTNDRVRRTLRTAVSHNHFRSPQRIFASKEVAMGSSKWAPVTQCPLEKFVPDIFIRLPDDEQLGLSQEDKQFLTLMDNKLDVNEQGFLVLPLPFKDSNAGLPSNYNAVKRRSVGTFNRMRRDPEMLQECVKAMEKSICTGKVEQVPHNELHPYPGRAWWIPCFALRHKRKGKIRLVYDSSAAYHGISLNNQLLQGPDQGNNLRGVITRFREGPIGFSADIEAMFQAFFVPPNERDFMRFFWYQDNDPSGEIVQFRACVHIFGNRSSPAVATYALRATCQDLDQSDRTRQFVDRNFYVDDGLGTAQTSEEAISILKGARKTLSKFNIRLHKIVASDPVVMNAFPSSEVAEDVTQVELDDDRLQPQSALGISWDIKQDEFFIRTNIPEKPFTRRGVPATVNAPYDNIGFTCPVILAGRLFQRKVMPRKTEQEEELSKLGWDDPLPSRFLPEWEEWKHSLLLLNGLRIPRGLRPNGFDNTFKQELHVFSDASQDAIGGVIYCRSVGDQNVSVAFLRGESRVAPREAKSIPRFELCAAVQATETLATIVSDLSRKPDEVFFYTDSLVVLGYLRNGERHFARYVARRIDIILNTSAITQWRYVPTDVNPGDIASRPTNPTSLLQSRWLGGPLFLNQLNLTFPVSEPFQEDALPEEISGDKRVLSATISPLGGHLTHLFMAHGRLNLVVDRVLRLLLRLRRYRNRISKNLGQDQPELSLSEVRSRVIQFLVLDAQATSYSMEAKSLKKHGKLPSNHRLASLSPFMDSSGIIRVGGRLKHSDFPSDVKHPILLPRKHQISKSILEHCHRLIQHQGRHVTAGAVREAGYHVEGSAQAVRYLVKHCEFCRRLRAPVMEQLMADLPVDRLSRTAPFTNCGLDVFGPFHVKDRPRTRSNLGTVKVWALLLTCLASRAVHVEVLFGLDTSSFRNSLRRFLAIRGTCKMFRSDRGTNFVDSNNQNLDLEQIQGELGSRGVDWKFNPPGASHFGGIWERKIGQVRRCLEGALLQAGPRLLSLDEFNTFLQEAVAVVNSTPLWIVSEDPNDPLPISPSSLLTLKEEPYSCPVQDFTKQDIMACGKLRWKRAQFLADQFWVRYRKTYFHRLQERNKWNKKQKNLEVGDFVLLRTKGAKRGHWPMARVESVKKSDDGLVRSAIVKTATSEGPTKGCRFSFYNRPISDLVFLSSTSDAAQGDEAKSSAESTD